MNEKKSGFLIIFDWGNTVMRDLGYPGAMKDWPVVEWIPYMKDVLPVLCSNFDLAIATSAQYSGTADMNEALARVDGHRFFRYSFSAIDLNVRKPDPAFFEQILERTGYSANQCISVGDKYEMDIIPAKSLGLKTIFFNEKEQKGPFPAADKVINSMDQLLITIEELTDGK